MRPELPAAGRLVPAALAAALLATACADTGTVSSTVDGDGSSPSPSPSGVTVDCGGSVYPVDALDDAPPVSALPDGPAGAVDDAGAPAFDPSLDWRVVGQSDSRVDLVRELDEPVDMGAGDVRPYESHVLELVTGSTNVPDGTWLLTSTGPCAQRVVGTDDVGAADLTLMAEPAPSGTTVDLLVTEQACASGRSADGRIELVALEETAEQVRLHVGVRALGGDQDCPGNPPTPFTVELTSPLGDREVVDAATVPARLLGVR